MTPPITSLPGQDKDQLESLLERPREIELLDGYKITLRPFTFGSVALAKRLGLEMFSGESDDEEETKEKVEEDLKALENEIEEEEISDEVMQELATFFWMQSQPVPEVLSAVRDGSWELKAEEFAHYIPIHKIAELLGETNRISQMASLAAVDVAPRDGTSDEDAPPN